MLQLLDQFLKIFYLPLCDDRKGLKSAILCGERGKRMHAVSQSEIRHHSTVVVKNTGPLRGTHGEGGDISTP